MAKNVIADAGAPIAVKTKNIASAKLSGDLISFPASGPGANVAVALLLKDAGSGEDGVPALIGGVTVRYAALNTDTAEPGAKLYLDIGNNRLTTTATANNYAGRAAKTKINGDTTADLLLGWGAP